MTAVGSHAAVIVRECFTMKNSLALGCLARSSLCLALVGMAACSEFVLADLPPLSPAAMANGASVMRVAGFEFVSIGGLGNAPVPRDMQVGFQYRPQLATVDYNYAVSRTEVTYAEYLPFVRAYVTHFDPTTVPSFNLEGEGILFAGGDTRNPQNYYLRPGYEHSAANVGYRFGARYCNWLNNDRANTAAALSTGAYDASTFLPDYTDGSQDHVARLPGAKFFMPTLSEWTKAMYFDGNRFGAGQAGYWEFPTASNNVPAFGLPSDGGETSAGLPNIGISTPLPVASYTNAMSPWGLFDGSGGAEEWLEESVSFDPQSRYTRGTGFYGSPASGDQIEWVRGLHSLGISNVAGIRIATVIPSVPTGLVVLFSCSVFFRRSR